MKNENNGWQPIETAPKDGTWVLAYPPLFQNTNCSVARFSLDDYSKNPRPYWKRIEESGSITLSRSKPPTHWMPLPAPPKP